MSKQKLYYIAIYILIFWILGVLDVSMRIFAQLNLPVVPFSKLIFGILPALYIIYYKGFNYKDLYSLVIPFILILWIRFYERTMLDEAGKIFLVEQLFFITFYFLTITKIDTSSKTTSIFENSIINSGLFYVLISYLFYLGIIKLSDGIEFQLGVERAALNIVNINHVSYLASLSTAFTVFKFKRGELSKRRFFIYIGMMTSIVIINSSRGAMIFLVLVLVVYLFNFKSLIRQTLLVFSLLILGFIVNNLVDIERLNIFYRFTDELEDISGLGRSEQIVANWENFQSSPFWGVGYNNAAKTNWANYGWSNSSFTQILAAYGIFFWLLLIFGFFRRIFWPGIRNLNKELIIILLFVFLFYFFNRLFLYPTVLAYFLFFKISLAPTKNTLKINVE
ncbi:MAG: O-antigen ligase family protein [Bacteroidales bacterium]|jgi:hypothetical protein|nr:O-antigen ligase family protein [Bacteroidales bacterium]